MRDLDRKYQINFELGNVNILITIFGDFFYEENANSVTHSHSGYEVQFVSEGTSTISTNLSTSYLSSSQACIISPGTIHTCIYNDQKTIKSSFCFSFERINQRSNIDVYKILSKAFSEVPNIEIIDDAERFLSEINKIIAICKENSFFCSEKLRLCFSYIILELADTLLKKHSDYINNGIPNYNSNTEIAEKNFRRILIEDYINQNYSTDISLETLSGVLHLSRKQVERIFLQEMNTNFKNYITKIRIEAAIHYLKNTDIPVSKISSIIGYNSYNGFYRVFMKKYGISPNEYREKYKK